VACRPVTRQRPVYSNRGMAFSAQSAPMAAHATMDAAAEERCFLVWSVPRCYKQDNYLRGSQSVEWSRLVNDLVRQELLWLRPGRVGEPRERGTSAVGSRYQAMAVKDCEDFIYAVVTANFGACNSVRLLSLFVITFCKCSISAVTNLNPIISQSYAWQC
jgi:hypothetical protein